MIDMKSGLTILTLFAAFALGGHCLAAENTPHKPNIVIILADDMGFSDIGCYGGEIATPNLDRLARNGLRFTQFYNTARCCPTRAALLTGLYSHQTGIGHMMGDKKLEGYRGDLNRRCVTIAEALKPAGYRNYAVGKWHLTPAVDAQTEARSHNWPLQRGFDRYYGTIHGGGSYFDPSALVRDNTLITVANDPEYQPREFYYTDAISDQAVRVIREHARAHLAQPFFLYVAYTAAHWPLHAKAADIARYKGRYDAGYEAVRAARWAREKKLGVVDRQWELSPLAEGWDKAKNREFEARCMEVYAAQVDCLDQGIGRIVAELKTQRQLDHTLLFYLQDNGGCAELVGRGTNFTARAEHPTLPRMSKDDRQHGTSPKQTRDGWPVRQGYGVMPGGPDTFVAYGRGWANVSNTPFREYKHWEHEGGISTPLIVHWPEGIARSRRGKLVNDPGHIIDIMATCLDLAGASYPVEFANETILPLEGVSLRRVFEGKSLERSQPIFWEHEGNRAVRAGQWKLVAKGPRAAWELHDMTTDRSETHDLASSEPALVAELAAKWESWAKRVHALPWPWDKQDPGEVKLSTQTHFELGPDANLARAEAPDYLNRAFTVTVEITRPAADGVLVAHGGDVQGWGIYFKAGTLHFVINRARQREDVPVANDSLASARIIQARLSADSTLTLTADGSELATRKLAGLPGVMPGDGLQVGKDLKGAVGHYTAPFEFRGEIRRVLIELEAR
jgi:arylsulfatase A-like enzyme